MTGGHTRGSPMRTHRAGLSPLSASLIARSLRGALRRVMSLCLFVWVCWGTGAGALVMSATPMTSVVNVVVAPSSRASSVLLHDGDGEDEGDHMVVPKVRGMPSASFGGSKPSENTVQRALHFRARFQVPKVDTP